MTPPRPPQADQQETEHDGQGEVQLAPVPPDASLLNSSEPLESAVLDNETANAVQMQAASQISENGTPTDGQRDTTQGTEKKAGQGVAKATAGIGALHVVRLLVGFVAQPLIANRLGLRAEADVYAVATDIVSSIWRIFEKAVNPTFLPCFMQALHDESEARAWRFASTTLWLTAIVLPLIAIASWLGMPWIVDLYSQKALASQREMTVAISRLLLAGLFFLGISSLTYVILNGYKRFALAALGDALWKIGVLVGAGMALAANASRVQSLYIIAWGFTIGAMLKLLPHLLALHSKRHLFKPRIDWRDPLVKKMCILAGPLLLGIFVSETRDIYLKWLADNPRIEIEGSRAALNYSRLIGSSLIQIFPYALSIGIFPYLADMARNRSRDRQPLTDTLMGALRVCVFTFGPLTAILIALHGPLLSAVWESGQMRRADTLVMALPFIWFALGLVAFSCEMMINQTFYAMTNVWTPTLVGLGTTVLWIGIATFGVFNNWGLAAIAAAESISKSVKCLVMWALLRRDLGDVRARENLVFCLKVLGGSIIAAMVAWAIVGGIAPAGEIASRMDKIKMLLAVAGAGMGGVVMYIALGAAAGVSEVRSLLSFVGNVRRRFARG